MTTEIKLAARTNNIFENILEKIPFNIITLYQNKIFYCNKQAADFFHIQGDILLSKPFEILLHRDSYPKVISELNSIQNNGNSRKKISGQIIRNGAGVVNVEFQFVPIKLINEQYLLVLFQEKSLGNYQEKIRDTKLKILLAMNLNSSLEEVCNYLYSTVKEIIDIKNFYVALYEKSNQSLSFPFYNDEYSSQPVKRKFGNGLTEFVITTKRTLLLNDKDIDEKIREGVIVPLNIPVKGWLGVPLLIHDDIAGAIVIKEYHRENFLDENVKQIIELVSYPISRVIEAVIVDQIRKSYTQKLQELNNSKDKFFSIISHDLKSPFNSILGFTEILKEQSETLEKEDLHQIYDALYNSARKTFNLLNNLLQYSRFQNGLEDFNPMEINLSEIIKENLALFEGILLKKQIKFIYNVFSNYMIFADKEMLNSILRNLINNAIKFTHPGGKVLINTHSDGNYVKITIKDTGVGMDKETINNLFKIESKKSTFGTNKEEGTGLGLILVKEFVDRHGGKISVNSKIGEGTDFSFTIKLFNNN